MNNNKSNSNFTELARLAVLAIGTRSYVTFAKDSGLSLSFITKLINCKLPAMPKKKTLLKVALASESRVTYEQLLMAAGYETDNISIELSKKVKPQPINNPAFIISEDVEEICTQISNLIDIDNINVYTVIVLVKKLSTLTILQHRLQTQNNVIIQYALILD